MKNVLIIEDESIIAIELEQIVTKTGMNVLKKATTKNIALECIKNNHIDIAFLDINLSGDFEGIDIAHYIMHESPTTSIIFITSYTDELILKAISDIDFSAYLIKPFKLEEIEVALNLEKIKLEKSDLVLTPLINGYTFNKVNSDLFYEKKLISLTKKERVLIKFLAEHQGQILTYESIDDFVWSGDDVNDNQRRNLIYKLNKKLPQKLISTAQGIGYYIKK